MLCPPLNLGISAPSPQPACPQGTRGFCGAKQEATAHGAVDRGPSAAHSSQPRAPAPSCATPGPGPHHPLRSPLPPAPPWHGGRFLSAPGPTPLRHPPTPHLRPPTPHPSTSPSSTPSAVPPVLASPPRPFWGESSPAPPPAPSLTHAGGTRAARRGAALSPPRGHRPRPPHPATTAAVPGPRRHLSSASWEETHLF